jgi:carboxymethylenebutenolidase
MLPELRRVVSVLLLVALGACARAGTGGASSDEHAGHAAEAPAPGAGTHASTDSSLAPGADDARARLAASPRHGEWVMIPAGASDSVRAWVVYPERSTKAPVVVVIHEIYGLSTWIRAVTDQLAADGFIAIAPDLLTGKYPQGSPTDTLSADAAVALIRTIDYGQVQRRIAAAGQYGMRLPAALPRYGVVGFCWGGAMSFQQAASVPDLGAAVVFYGQSPSADDLKNVRAPVLGLYGGNDARVNATIAPADSALKPLGRTYDHFVFEGAGHGFLRAQAGQNGANTAAAAQAWPKTVAWFHKYLGG